MKFSAVAFNSFALIIAFFGTYSAEAKGLSVIAVSDEPSKHPFGACDADNSLIRDEISKAAKKIVGDQVNPNQNLRSLYTCTDLCRSFSRGTCWVAYPTCWPMRRLRDLKDDAGDAALAVLPDNIKEDHSMKCAKAILAVEETMAGLVDTVQSAECKSALKDPKTYRCFMES